MSLKVNSRIPSGNAADAEIVETGDMPEVRFASDPADGPEALWFHFRLTETEPEPPRATKVRLVWKHFDNVLGGETPAACVPVCQAPGQAWTRLKQGEETRLPDGRRQAVWYINHPAPSMDIAFCFPYGPADVEALVDRAKAYWQCDTIGVSQGGHRLVRMSNAPGTPGGTQPGLYLVARQHAGETPGSWVLDGLLRHMAQIRKAGYVVWCVPLADIDGVLGGAYGKDRFPYDLNRAWGQPAMRHETLVLREDLRRWKERCRPILALDFHAPGACERHGVYAYASGDAADPLTAEATRWANTIQNELKAEFAAGEFKRVATYPSRWETPRFGDYVQGELKVPALSLEIPYGLVGAHVLTQKDYREIGKRMVDAIFRRSG